MAVGSFEHSALSNVDNLLSPHFPIVFQRSYFPTWSSPNFIDYLALPKLVGMMKQYTIQPARVEEVILLLRR
jgi:hypothetical protein